MDLSVDRSGSAGDLVDLTVTGMDARSTVGDLADALELDPTSDGVTVDGRHHDRSEQLGGVALCDGSLIRPSAVPVDPLVGADADAGVDDRSAPAPVVARVAGLGTGSTVELATGISDVGPVGDPAFRVRVRPDGATTVDALAPDVEIDGVTVRTPNAVYRLRPARAGRRRPLAGPVRRPPRIVEPEPTVTVVTPSRPDPPHPAPPLSWPLLVAPIPLGIVMALWLSPFFLAFTLMSPLMTVARWLDGRRRRRRDTVRVRQETADRLGRFGADLLAAAAREADRRRADHLDLDALAETARWGGPDLWAVRPHHPDHLAVTVGYGEVPWLPNFGGEGDLAGVDDVMAGHGRLVGVPVVADLREVGAVGVVGSAPGARATAAALVLELAVRHGPADVALALGPVETAEPAWDWVKWLPHLTADDGGRAATTVWLVDGSAPADVAPSVRAGEAVAVVVAERADQLPAWCGVVVDVDDTGVATVVDVARAAVAEGVVAVVADPGVVAGAARGLARFVDPEVSGPSRLPARCHLVALSPTEPVWPGEPRGLTAVIGTTGDAPLTVDLVADGPHALVAGTTGAGKSELLRSLVASLALRHDPTQVNFVLVDFKGGGAFDTCAGLPHTVGVVTDLDEHLAERALRCLRAELRHRERRLRAAGVSDLADLDPAGALADGPLPRLVVVVDEFATLATELPDFLGSLVDVAQRGRSLGIHLVLATQRPSGVVDAKIRANTNLRIALRVQDVNDSIDVLGGPDAADLDRRRPGRALARLGVGELVPFQAALVSEPSPRAAGGVRVAPFELRSLLDPAPAAATPPADGSDLARIVATTRAAAASSPPPRVPWPPPLARSVDLSDLPSADRPWSAALGLVDRPDEQCQDVLRWSADDGNVLLYGSDPADTAAVMTTFCGAVARSHPPDRAHLYVVDFSGAMVGVDALPHVGAVLGPADDERIDRLMRRLDDEMVRRRELQRSLGATRLGPDDVPMLMVLVANHAGLIEHFDARGDLEAEARLTAVVRDGPALGVFVVASATTERGIPLRLAGQVPTKYVMGLADPGAYTAFGLRPAEVPDLGPGRAVAPRTGHEVQFACVDQATMAEWGAAWSGVASGPPPLRVLPTVVDRGEVVGCSSADDGVLRLAVGIDHDRLAPAHLELRAGDHAAVLGPAGSGRTTVLRSIVAAAAELPSTPDLATIGLDGPAPTPVADVDHLEALLATPGLLVIDDIEVVDRDLVRAVERAASEPTFRRHLVVAGRPETFAGGHPLGRLVAAARTGVLLQPATGAGDAFRLRLPAVDGAPVGRGHLVNSGRARLAQFAMPGDQGVGPSAPRSTTASLGVGGAPTSCRVTMKRG